MIIKVNNEAIDINVLVKVNDNYIDIDYIEFDGLQNICNEITYHIIGYFKYSNFNKDIKVAVSGTFDKDKFTEDIHNLQMFGTALKPIIDDYPKLNITIPHNFSTLEDIAAFMNFYYKEGIISNLLIENYQFLRKCPKAAEAAKIYFEKNIKSPYPNYFNDIENIMIEFQDLFNGTIDFSWVDPKYRKIVFDELKNYCNFNSTYKELYNNIKICLVEIKPISH